MITSSIELADLSALVVVVLPVVVVAIPIVSVLAFVSFLCLLLSLVVVWLSSSSNSPFSTRISCTLVSFIARILINALRPMRVHIIKQAIAREVGEEEEYVSDKELRYY